MYVILLLDGMKDCKSFGVRGIAGVQGIVRGSGLAYSSTKGIF